MQSVSREEIERLEGLVRELQHLFAEGHEWTAHDQAHELLNAAPALIEMAKESMRPRETAFDADEIFEKLKSLSAPTYAALRSELTAANEKINILTIELKHAENLLRNLDAQFKQMRGQS